MRRRPREGRNAALLIALVMPGLCFALQVGSVFPTLPALQRDLHTTTAWSTWIVTVFALAAGVAAPIVGKVGDRRGHQRVLLGALALMLVGAAGTAAAPNVWVVIGFRGLQGVGGGSALPLCQSLIAHHVPPERTRWAVGLLSAMMMLGNTVALLVAAIGTDVLSWRAIFVAVAIVAAVCLVLAYRYVPDVRGRAGEKADYVGGALLALSTAALLLAISEANAWGWGSSRTTALFATAALGYAAWTLVELRSSHPMVDLRMLTRRTVLAMNVGAWTLGFVSLAIMTTVPRLLAAPRGLEPQVARLVDYGFGASSTVIAFYLLPGMASWLLCIVTFAWISRRYGAKWPLVLGLFTWFLTLAAFAEWHAEPWQVLLAMFTFGYGVPLAQTTTAKMIVDEVRPHERGVAIGLHMVFLQTGAVLGAQLCAAIVSSDTIPGTSVATDSAYSASFVLCAAVSLAAVPVALLATSRRAGRHEAAIAPSGR